MTAAAKRASGPAPKDASQSAYMRLEDAQRGAMRCAAMLGEYFELKATQHQDDDAAMWAAMGFEDLAREIMAKLTVIERAACDLRGAR